MDDPDLTQIHYQHTVKTQSTVSSIYKPLLHRDGHPGGAFFRKEDAVVTDLSSIAAGDIRSQINQS